MTFPSIRFHDVVRGKAIRGLGAGTLLLGLIAGQLVPQLVSAQIGGSRTGPVISLSDGTKINLTAVIDDTASDVQQVAYTLHAPAGTSVTRVVYTGSLAGHEAVRLAADAAPGVYLADTVVTAGQAGIGVTVDMQIPGVGSTSASGVSGQAIQTEIDK